MRARRLLIPLATLGLLLTSGCTAAGPEPGASGSPSAGEPFFASEEEAVEAALAVYEEYAATADAIMADGGENPERLEPLTGQALYETQSSSFERMRAAVARGSGTTEFELHAWQQEPDVHATGLFASAYICRDVSGVDVVGPDGESIVDPGRLDVIPTEVAWSISQDGTIRVTKDEPWLPENFCL